jgi:hypothetical protein
VRSLALCRAHGSEKTRASSVSSSGDHDLATLHAFHVDKPHAIAGVDRNRDDASTGRGVALFARRERAHAGLPDG